MFGEDEPARAGWDELRPSFDLDRMEDGSFALMPLLYRRVDSWGLDDPLLPRLKGLYRHTWYRGNLLLERLKEVVHEAVENRIDLMVADEPLLIERVYRDRGLRPATRLDLLIRPEEAESLIGALERHGWRRRSPSGLWLQHPSGPHAVLQHGLLPTRAPLGIGEPGTHWLSSTDQLLRTCVGEARHNLVNRLQWIADAKLQIDTGDREIDWERLLQTAESLKASLQLRDAISYLSRRVAAAVPSDVCARLDTVRPRRRERLVHELRRVDGRGLVHKVLPAPLRRTLRRVISPR